MEGFWMSSDDGRGVGLESCVLHRRKSSAYVIYNSNEIPKRGGVQYLRLHSVQAEHIWRCV